MRLHFYIARRFFWTFAAVFAVFAGLMALFDLMDQVRRFSDTDASFAEVLGLTILSTPQGLYQILPLIALVSALALFLNLARTSELVVTRAAGRSALRSLIAPGFTILILGAVSVGILNPIVAATLREYESRASALKGETESVLSVSDQGLWLRQGSDTEQTVIRANRSNLDGTVLTRVTFLTLNADSEPLRRIEARRAELQDGAWLIKNAKVWPFEAGGNAELSAEEHRNLTIPSTLTKAGIRDSFGTPSAIQIWDLPGFISQLEAAGFSGRRHLMWLQMELAQPAFWLAMMLIGAAFSLKPGRSGGIGQRVLVAVLLGFGLYFVRNFVQILGESGQMPIWLAAWTPPLAAIGLATGLLLHLEDG